MPVWGNGGRQVLIVGEAPGELEDELGRPFVGKSGQFLHECAEKAGIRLERDTWITNALICRPPGNKIGDERRIEYCHPNLKQTLAKLRPKVVITLGKVALQSVLMGHWQSVGSLEKWVGRKIPIKDYWVCPTWHPSYLIRTGLKLQDRYFISHLREAVRLAPVSVPVTKVPRFELVEEDEKVPLVLKRLKPGLVAVDYETNCLKPEYPGARAVSCAVSDGDTHCSFLLGPAAKDALAEILFDKKFRKVASNLKFEERWTRFLYGRGVVGWEWDTMLAAHCLDTRPEVCGLKFCAFVEFGIGEYDVHISQFLKDDRSKLNQIGQVSTKDLLQYGAMDAWLEWELACRQQERISKHDLAGYRLLHRGVIELARVEANGTGISIEKLRQLKLQIGDKMKSLESQLFSSEVWARWRKQFGDRSTWRSRQQLVAVLKGMGVQFKHFTATGRESADDEALSHIDNPAIQALRQLLRCHKVLNTYLKGIESEVCGNRIHPIFNLHTVRTFRSSSERPNFQNIPVRDAEVGRLVRQLFVVPKGCVFVENDFKGVEVSISACYHKDEQFISYLTTPGKDMHRDMAAEIFMLPTDKVTKEARYIAKNKFVFPQFYGDFYASCARAIWNWMEHDKVGQKLLAHLQSKGITQLGACNPDFPPVSGTFEYHIREIERRFWNKRFPGYNEWRNSWWMEYCRTGKFRLNTGFTIDGILPRNAVINYPIQGTAFHCLLWTLIHVNKAIRKRGMKAKIVGQVHDSLLAQVPVEELEDYLELVHRTATEDLRKEWDWIVVPLEIECQITKESGSWFDLRPVKLNGRQFVFQDKTYSKAELLKTLQDERAV
jgi:uracil-DNA glycosylase family 4